MSEQQAAAVYERLLDAGPPVRRMVRTALRIVASVSALVLVYVFLPLKQEDFAFASFLVVLAGLALFVWLFVRELGKVLRDQHPELRSIEALANVATFFVLVFALGYVVMSNSSPAAFGEPLTKVDGLYFSMTVLSTVGFGDIHPVAEGARVLVTAQMVLDLVLIGVAVRLLSTTAKMARRRLVRVVAEPEQGSS